MSSGTSNNGRLMNAAMPWEASEEKPTAPSTVITCKGHFGASTVSRVAPDDGSRKVPVCFTSVHTTLIWLISDAGWEHGALDTLRTEVGREGEDGSTHG